MEKSYTEKIQIHKDNKLAALYPSTKLLVVCLYIVCTFIIGTVHVTSVGLSLLLIPWFIAVPVLSLIHI